MKSSTGDTLDESRDTIKVIGIGQSLRGDDAAGLAAVRLWQQIYQAHAVRPNVQVELAELPGIGLLDLLQDARLVILVDAVRSQAIPGTIHVVSEEKLDSFIQGTASAHGWGVAETLSIGRKLMPSALTKNLVVIGIEVGQLDFGEALSPEVEAALPEAARLIEQYVVAPPFTQGQSISPRISPR